MSLRHPFKCLQYHEKTFELLGYCKMYFPALRVRETPGWTDEELTVYIGQSLPIHIDIFSSLNCESFILFFMTSLPSSRFVRWSPVSLVHSGTLFLSFSTRSILCNGYLCCQDDSLHDARYSKTLSLYFSPRATVILLSSSPQRLPLLLTLQ